MFTMGLGEVVMFEDMIEQVESAIIDRCGNHPAIMKIIKEKQFNLQKYDGKVFIHEDDIERYLEDHHEDNLAYCNYDFDFDDMLAEIENFDLCGITWYVMEVF